MHFRTVSVFLAALIAAASAAPPANAPPAHHPPPHPLPPCKPGHAWPDHLDCHSFFECAAGGQPVRKTCGPGTAYCWQVGVCVAEKDVPSCPNAGPALAHPAPPHSAPPHPETPHPGPEHPDTPHPDTPHPGPEHPAPPHPGPEHPAPPHSLPPCKPGHAWPDHHDCHSFFECAAGGHPVRKTCGPGTAYCWQIGVCVAEKDVPSCPNAGPANLPKGLGHPGPKGHH